MNVVDGLVPAFLRDYYGMEAAARPVGGKEALLMAAGPLWTSRFIPCKAG